LKRCVIGTRAGSTTVTRIIEANTPSVVVPLLEEIRSSGVDILDNPVDTVSIKLPQTNVVINFDDPLDFLELIPDPENWHVIRCTRRNRLEHGLSVSQAYAHKDYLGDGVVRTGAADIPNLCLALLMLSVHDTEWNSVVNKGYSCTELYLEEWSKDYSILSNALQINIEIIPDVLPGWKAIYTNWDEINQIYNDYILVTTGNSCK